MTAKVWFITGTSTGFGRELVEALIARHEKVVATARNLTKIADWQNQPNVLLATVDVTKPEQIKTALTAAVAKFGRIDVLVNNAGWGYFGAVEESDDTQVRRMMETNFWGVSNVTRAVLPIMRQQKHGYIMNITSIAGLLGNPAFGYYNATKHAVEGLMKALRQEVAPLGIHITNIEPGPFRTDWAGRSHVGATALIADYAQTAHVRRQQTETHSGQQAGSPVLLAQAMIKLSQVAEPPFHFIAGQNAFDRMQVELTQEQRDFDQWQADSTHLNYGDEAYWQN
jgi:NAD(P)-dependent dehydrogenase (short-subunit alcohol dehydrogenase family)